MLVDDVNDRAILPTANPVARVRGRLLLGGEARDQLRDEVRDQRVLVFERDPGGRILGFRVFVGDARGIGFKKIK